MSLIHDTIAIIMITNRFIWSYWSSISWPSTERVRIILYVMFYYNKHISNENIITSFALHAIVRSELRAVS